MVIYSTINKFFIYLEVGLETPKGKKTMDKFLQNYFSTMDGPVGRDARMQDGYHTSALQDCIVNDREGQVSQQPSDDAAP